MLIHSLATMKTRVPSWPLAAAMPTAPRFGVLKVAMGEKGALSVNDESALNWTCVNGVYRLPADTGRADILLQEVLRLAKTGKLSISVAGAAHTQGGHTIAPNGLVIDMANYKHIETVDETTIRVQAGAIWKDVIAYLNPQGKSLSIMQSNNDFAIGGSVGANAHGWQVNKPPLISSIKGLHLLTASGEKLYCSRDQHAELFKSVVGGYGLFGIVMDVDLATVDNERYRLKKLKLKQSDYIKTFHRLIEDNPRVAMAYGRLNVSRKNFLEDAVLTLFEREPQTDRKVVSDLTDSLFRSVGRKVVGGAFKMSYGNEEGKRARWWLENNVNVFPETMTRNKLFNESSAFFKNKDPRYTDILQEYFIPFSQFNAFIERMRCIIPESGTDLLNVTIRDVKADKESAMPYARQDCLGLVLFFRQRKAREQEEQMERMTRRLIDEAIGLQGSYYLPYRPHATIEQFQKAYPEKDRLLALKAQVDPEGFFKNQFHQKYLSSGA